VRNHYEEFFAPDDARSREVRARTYELSEFLVDVLGVDKIPGRFPHRVGIHQSCHGLRELRLGPASERMDGAAAPVNRLRRLLGGLEGIQLCDVERPDECCGFGGTFAVAEEAVSCMMGQDRIEDHEKGGAEVLTAGDMSCLMHLDGLIKRQKKPLAVMHLAQILAGRPVPAVAR
jgi:L-lactate dehydrogenase complex protein LldE